MKELYSNESIDFRESRNVDSLNKSDEFINEKYVKGEVRIITEQARYPLNTILSMVESDDYILNPEFQRRHRWDNTKKSRLIESFIMNVPIPPVFLYEVKYSVYEVMDGLQRMTAISQFYKDRFALQDLEEWPELNGKLYSQLPEQIRRGIDRRYLSPSSSTFVMSKPYRSVCNATQIHTYIKKWLVGFSAWLAKLAVWDMHM